MNAKENQLASEFLLRIALFGLFIFGTPGILKAGWTTTDVYFTNNSPYPLYLTYCKQGHINNNSSNSTIVNSGERKLILNHTRLGKCTRNHECLVTIKLNNQRIPLIIDREGKRVKIGSSGEWKNGWEKYHSNIGNLIIDYYFTQPLTVRRGIYADLEVHFSNAI
ncbi:MAG: hypothetical protein JW725_02370 [Candidatus Babeliaceae bacterium]|nr:hypothetical protein [Candidatus Babeliaceae bacterium]